MNAVQFYRSPKTSLLEDWMQDFYKPFHKNLEASQYATNIHEEEDKFVVEMDVPGFNLEKKELKIQYKDGILNIHGEKKTHEDKNQKGKYLLQERSFLELNRSFRIPKINDENIEAKVVQGVLTITLPKKEEAKAKTIEIVSGS